MSIATLHSIEADTDITVGQTFSSSWRQCECGGFEAISGQPLSDDTMTEAVNAHVKMVRLLQDTSSTGIVAVLNEWPHHDDQSGTDSNGHVTVPSYAGLAAFIDEHEVVTDDHKRALLDAANLFSSSITSNVDWTFDHYDEMTTV